MLSSRPSFFAATLALLASTATHVQHVAAQTSTSCQPLNSTCPPDPGFGMDYTFYFNATPIDQAWEVTNGNVEYDPTNGATFTINQQGDAPTIRTQFYYFFGRTEIWLKTSPGVGIVSSLMMLSDDLDEIDFEFLGGNATYAETNYFGKGRTTGTDYADAIYYPVTGGTQADYHNYTSVWTNTSLEYWIDGGLVRTLLPAEANNTNNYPQTPMRLSMGIWAGGDPSLPNGTREWAGGTTDYADGPFTMYVKSARITDFNSGSEYTYGDMTGDWQSIQVVVGNSTAKQAIDTPPQLSLAQKWDNLSPVVHIVVYACAAGVGAALLAFLTYYFIKQRRVGRAEALAAEQRANEDRMEMERFRKAGVNPDSFAGPTGAALADKEAVFSTRDLSAPSSPGSSMHDEKPWGASDAGYGAAASAGMGAAAAAGAMRSRMASPGPDRSMYNRSPAVVGVQNGYGGVLNSPASPTSPRGPSRSPAPMGSPVSRVGSPVGVPPRFNTPGSPGSVNQRGPMSPALGGAFAAEPPNRMRTPGPMIPTSRSQTMDGYGGGGGGAPGYVRDNGPGYGPQGGYGHGGGGGANDYWR